MAEKAGPVEEKLFCLKGVHRLMGAGAPSSRVGISYREALQGKRNATTEV